MSAALQSSDVQAIEAQARAADAFAGALAANRKPQVQWNTQYGHTGGATDATDWQVGIRVAIPLYDPAARHAEQAALKRAEATKMQRADVVRERPRGSAMCTTNRRRLASPRPTTSATSWPTPTRCRQWGVRAQAMAEPGTAIAVRRDEHRARSLRAAHRAPEPIARPATGEHHALVAGRRTRSVDEPGRAGSGGYFGDQGIMGCVPHALVQRPAMDRGHSSSIAIAACLFTTTSNAWASASNVRSAGR